MNARRSMTAALPLLGVCAALVLLLPDRGEITGAEPISIVADSLDVAQGRYPAVESIPESSSRSALPTRELVSEVAGPRAEAPEIQRVAERRPSVRGRVLTPEGRVLGDPQIVVSANGMTGRPSFTKPDGAGSFELYDLEPGVWWIAASGPGRKKASRSIVLGSAGLPVEVELVLERTPVVRIHVIAPDGRPFPEALGGGNPGPRYWHPAVLATREPIAASFLPQSMSAESIEAIGRCNLRTPGSDLPATCIGELELFQEPPLHLSLMLHRAVLASQELVVFHEDVSFVLDPDAILRSLSGLRLRVVDGVTARPLAGVRVLIWSDDVIGGSTPVLSTEADGSIDNVPCPPGPRTLLIENQGYETVEREIVLPPGEVLDLGTITLEEGTVVRVRVRGADHPEKFVVCCERLSELRSERRWSGFLSEIHSNPQGEFEVRTGEGEWVVRAQGGEATLQRSAYTLLRSYQAGAIVELEVVDLVPLVLQPTRSEEPRTIEIRDGLDILMERPREVRAIPVRYELIPGRYRLFVGRSDGIRDERVIDLGRTELEITLD